MQIPEYEFHFETAYNLTEVIDMLKSKGWRVSAELHPEGGVKLHLMHSGEDNSMNATICLYEHEGNEFEYELKTGDKETFMKLHDVILQA